MTLKHTGIMAAALLAMGESFGGELPEYRRREIERSSCFANEKSCLYCGKAHKHNNSYCSAECCKLAQQQTKEVKGG